ncbi:12471_t:CDS:2, partial [Funneliformis geosporum]
MTAILQQCLFNKQPVHFMLTAVSDEAKYINGVSTYILRISGCLINWQKTIVNVMGIKPFFDVVVPEETSLPTFKTRLALKIVREVGISTASDDLNPTYYYRKVACEKRLPLSSWAVLSNYSYKGNSSTNVYSFQVSVNNYNPI